MKHKTLIHITTLVIATLVPIACAWLLFNWIEPIEKHHTKPAVIYHEADSMFTIIDTLSIDTVPMQMKRIREKVVTVANKDTVIIYQEEDIVLIADTDTVVDQTKTARNDSLHPFHYLVRAVGWAESRDQDNARNGSHIGYLQISPGVVTDVNNYLEKKGINKRYTLADRYSREKSIEMYYIFQEIHNPTMDIEKAIRDWRHGPYFRGTTNRGYRNSVLKRLKELEEEN